MPEYIAALKEPAGSYALLVEDNWEEAMYLAEGALKGNVIQTFPLGLTGEAGMAKTFPLGKWVEVTRKEDGGWELEYSPDFRLPDYMLARMEPKAHAAVANGGGVVYGVPGENILSLIQEVRHRRRKAAEPLGLEELTRRLEDALRPQVENGHLITPALVSAVRDWMDNTPRKIRSAP